MSSVQREEVVKTRTRFVVDAAEPWGATLKDIQLAIHLALQEREGLGLDNSFDDSLRFAAEDDKIVIYFDVDKRPG